MIRTTGAARVIDGLAGMSRQAGTLGYVAAPAVALEVSRGYMRSLMKKGPGWPPLKASTVRQRIADGYPPGPPLVMSGRLKRALREPIIDTDWDGETFKVRLSYAGPVLAKRPVKLDRISVRATTRALSRTLHSAYRGG